MCLDVALEHVLGRGRDVLVEIAPHPVLGIPLMDASSKCGGFAVASLRRETGLEAFSRSLGQLHVHGYPVDWARLLGERGGGLVPLPTYAFQRDRYWLKEGTSPSDAGSLGLYAVGHPLLGAMTALADGGGLLFTGRLSLSTYPWLADHTVFGSVAMPGTGMLELALAAASAVGSRGVSELTLLSPLLLPERDSVVLQVSVGIPDADGRRSIMIHAQPEGAAHTDPWSAHASGTLEAAAEVGSGRQGDRMAWRSQGAVPLELSTLYEELSKFGFDYGPAFRGLVEAWKVGERVCGRVELPDAIAGEAEDYCIHPALLDATLHGLLATSLESGSEQQAQLFSWTDVTLEATGARAARFELELAVENDEQATVSLAIEDETGQPLARVGGLRMRRVSAEQVRMATASRADRWDEAANLHAVVAT